MRTSKLIATAALVLSWTGCPKPGPQPPAPPVIETTCQNVCDTWRELGCEEAEPTPSGETCEAVCENVQSSGIILWDLDCRASVTACWQIDTCEE